MYLVIQGDEIIAPKVGRAHGNRGSSIRTIHLVFTLASVPVVSLLPPYRTFALPFDPDTSF